MARVNGSTWSGSYNSYLFLDYSYTQNVAGNYSDISYSFGLHFTQGHFRCDFQRSSWTAWPTASGSSSWDGPNTGSWPWPGHSSSWNGSYEVVMHSGVFRLFHDSAGSGSAQFYGECKPSSAGGGGTRALDTTVWMPGIPRQPSAPGTPSVSGHNDFNPTTATISWSAPSNIGAGLVDRQIQISTNSGFSTTHTNSTAAWGTSYGVNGLAKNRLYYVRVRASSSAGWGPWSTTRTFTTGTTVPSAPGTPVAGAITYTSIGVSWSAPSDNGGQTISSYVVERATNSGFTTGLASYKVFSTLGYTISGLTEGTSYWVRVKAVNATGTSAASGTLATGTQAATVPSAPGTPTFSNVTGTTMNVSWTAPSSNNGAAITSYTLEYSTTSLFTTFTTRSGIASLTTQVTGLDYGDTYYFRAKAVNAKGTSVASATSSQMTASTTPFAPATPSITNVAQLSARVNYSAPLEDGGSAITGYDIQRATNSGFTQNAAIAVSAASPLDITGLIPATTYYVRVRAKNANGNGAWSPATSFAALPSMQLYNGSTWVGCQIHVGAGLILATTQKWDGSAWV